jgi:A/G-specific adenine glycosylase
MIPNFTQTILDWFAKNRRNLPWRGGVAPWHILASEIMLQQTQVDRVKPKFAEFTKRWPTAKDLAETSTQQFLQFWSGLGYNRRALNLHRTATKIATDHHNIVPNDYSTLLELPGIGKYTAAAVLSFAHNTNITLSDTNVRRIFYRYFYGGEFAAELPEEQTYETKLAEAFPDNQSRNWHSALMDFGALICTSRSPQCQLCPLQVHCQAAPQILRGAETGQNWVRPQSTFQGSLRQLRGAIIKSVSAEIDGITLNSLKKRHQDPRFDTVLTALAKEGFIRRENDRIYA